MLRNLIANRLIPSAIVAGFVVAIVGCGSSGPSGTVTGKVTVGGNPPPANTQVIFVEANTSKTAGGITTADGSYSLRMGDSNQVATGTYSVAVRPPVRTISDEEAMELSMKGETPDLGTGGIDPKFTNPETSGLSFTVNQGANTYDITIE